MAQEKLAGVGDAVGAMRSPGDAVVDVAIFLKRADEGGVSRVACILASGFAEEGIRTQVVLAERGGAAERLLSNEVAKATPLKDSAGYWLLRRLSRPAAIVAALAVHLRRSEPRVLISPGNNTHVTATLGHALSGGAGRTRLIVKITNPIIKERHGRLKRWYRTRLYRWIFSRAASILVLSQGRVEQLARMYPDAAGKLRFVHNPYVTSAMLRAEGPVPATVDEATDPVILAVGRLAEQKNYAMLLRAMARIGDLSWRLIILGTGPQEEQLKALAIELGIASRVTFEGYVADPASYFLRARLLALSSTYEDLPAVVLEALGCGCPVVATACSEAVVSIIVETRHGEVVPKDDDAAFAQAISKLLASPMLRQVPPAILAYSVENGVAEHLRAIRPSLAPERCGP